MIDQPTIDRLAAELFQAERSGIQVEQFSRRFPDITIEDGYRVARAGIELRCRNGRHVRGHKIGLTSQAMQRMVQIDEPDYGTLLDDMFFSEGSTIPAGRFIVPLVEVELAFVLGRALRGPSVTIFDVLAATDYVVPAIEIVDSRMERIDRTTKGGRKIQDTIADNAASAGVVLGARPVRPDAFDLRWVGGLLFKNGVLEETGLAAGVLNHPANGVAWLARKLSLWDEHLEAGEIVLGGSFTRMLPAASGDQFFADFGELGAFSIRFG
jgi:2-oxo-hept-3-ene-1,7-dioate hydratase